ncbi:MAG: trypsin-like peptidase domain-containing protein [Planctomycetaceae bacterium]|jgi:hypothetical protein|nr:trypsin-like peptidase domain-containing protein [Planctomycetaceae bacterium]
MFRSRAILSITLILIFDIFSAFAAAEFSALPEPATKLFFITAANSSSCELAIPLMKEFAQKGYNIQTISVAQNPTVLKQFNITRLPAFILIQDDKIIDRIDGGSAPVVLKPMIQGMFDRVDQAARKNVTKISTPPANVAASNHYAKINENLNSTTNSNLNSTAITNSNATSTPTAPSISPSTPLTFNSNNANNVNHTDSFDSVAASASAAIAINNNIDDAKPNFTNSDVELLKRKFITSSVKLRVDSADGHSWGSGTIIDTRGADALILTCGHIFREAGVADNNGKISVEVHLYGENSSVKVYGRCIYYDLEIDLALVVIVPPCPVHAIPVAPSNFAINAGQNVISVGCDGGADPTIRKHAIMSINKISTPSSNKLPFHYIQVSGAPVGGRSGGGLFSANGYLIGVCNTADPIQNDGHFVPAEIIRRVLDQQNLSVVYKNPSLKNTKSNELAKQNNAANQHNANNANIQTPRPPRPAIAKPLLPIATQLENNISQNKSKNYSDNFNSNQNSQISNSNDEVTNLNQVERATLSEVKRRLQDGDEVILIVRSRRNLEMPSDVIVLNNTSEQFIDTLIQQSPAKLTVQNENAQNNQIILSSHENANQKNLPQPVTFNVPHEK